MRDKGKSLLAVLFSVVVLALPSYSQIQDSVKQADQYYPDFRKDTDMQIRKARGEKGIQYGGWLTPVFLTEQNAVPTAPSSIITTLKLWANIPLGDAFNIYVRGKDTFIRTLEDSEIIEQNDNLIDLDVGFIGFKSPGKSIGLYAGRKYYVLGTGLVFNGRGDGGEVDFYSRFVDLKVFAAYTGLLQKDNNPYKLSDKDIADGAKRLFIGGSVSTTIANQTIYLLGLYQKDNGEEGDSVKTRYDSQYYGGGLKGVLFKDLSYYGEFIYQTGTSYIIDSSTQEDIKAYAALAGLTYYFDVMLKPALLLQYSYASGDSDRVSYNSATGNTNGSDTGFITFGTYTAGFALRPLPGNLHVYRAGAAFVPFESFKSIYLKRMTLIGKYSYYRKDKSDSPINTGADATLDEAFVGQGIDIALRWKILSDVNTFANYALFIPGDAYSDLVENRTFFMLGVTLFF